MLNNKECYVVGIDEAGRGPLIGDMFIAGIVLSKNTLNKLSVMGVKDSKKLSPSRRKELFPKIISVAKAIMVLRYGPQLIDKINLTSLTLKGFINILASVRKMGLCVERVYIDAINSRQAPNIIRKYMPKGSKLTYEIKADEKYVAVSAASIIAKYLRDTHVELMRNYYGDFGSGYPSDPKTIKWLEGVLLNNNINELPPIVRRSWKTLRKFLTEGTMINSEKTLLDWSKESLH